MIALLTGIVAEQEAKSLIVNVQGVGYRVKATTSLVNSVLLGQELTLRIYHQVSADAEALYGFITHEDLRFFELLLTVPSVGPKTALTILEVAPPKVLAQAVMTGDVKLLTKISGVGKKTAERILIELKNKIKDLPAGLASVPITGMVGDVQEETMSVLMNMGMSRSQAREVVQNLPSGVGTVEEAVKAALKQR